MIKNERQYRITQAHAAKFRATLNDLIAASRPKNVHPKLWAAQKAGVQSQLRDLEAELREYERLKSDGPKTLKLNSLDALPKVLIQARIAAGLTQEDLAARLAAVKGLAPERLGCFGPPGDNCLRKDEDARRRLGRFLLDELRRRELPEGSGDIAEMSIDRNPSTRRRATVAREKTTVD